MKTTDKEKQKDFPWLDTPLAAKKAGRKVELRPDWEKIKFSVMKSALHQKFRQNPDLLLALMETGEAVLHEDSPYDFVWGWRNNGQDLLGKALMEVRAEIRADVR